MRYYCGTPQTECSGSYSKESGTSHHKLHSSVIEAQRCFIRYIRSLGFVRDSQNKNRFTRNDGGPAKFVDKRIS